MNRDDDLARGIEFDAWYTLHHARIRRLCARILRDDAAAEDIAQEALLRAWTHRYRMRSEDLGAWLSVVARNLCVSALRRDGRTVPTDTLPERADLADDPVLWAERKETRRNVRRALSKLAERQRRALYLREVGGLPYDEVGSSLGLTPEGARTVAFRARRLLREQLAAVGEALSGFLIAGIPFKDLRLRVRQELGAGANHLIPAMQSGLNAILVVGMILSSVGVIPRPARPAAPDSVTPVAVAPATTLHKASTDGRTTAPAILPRGNEGSSGARRGDPRIAPKITARPLDPDDKSSEMSIGVGDRELFYFSGHPQRGDGLDAAYFLMDVALQRLCSEWKEICSQLAGP